NQWYGSKRNNRPSSFILIICHWFHPLLHDKYMYYLQQRISYTVKEIAVFLFSKYFLNPNIYYRATFYTTKKRTIVVVIILSTECSFLYQLFYYTFLPRLNSK